MASVTYSQQIVATDGPAPGSPDVSDVSDDDSYQFTLTATDHSPAAGYGSLLYTLDVHCSSPVG